MMEIIFLGCGGGMPTPERSLASMMINYEGRKILIDCGEGTQVSMKMVGRGFKTIDIICITHIHGDHIIGLPGLLSTIGNSGKVDPLIIIGPKGIAEAVKSLMYIVPYLPYELRVIENYSGSIDFGDKYSIKELGVLFKPMNIQISSIELEHSSPCFGYSFYIKRNPKFNIEKAIENNVPKNIWNKLQIGEEIIIDNKLYTKEMVLGTEREGLKISYITDTRPILDINNFVYNSDLFVCEGTYGKEEDIDKAIRNKHMTFKEAASIAANSNVKKLILTHFSPALKNPEDYIDNAKAVFNESYLAKDRLIETLKFN
ncbi:ribonuclease Z [Clostridium cylindrosporum]|uniref:Ribonuclease Z n=1 Tax=Clostridium cylindrosporum DSM 605 TaxID=1121307 RepID=A0A0J8G6E4_CLOCY|nr:ribonuclease Z [Clostridium cylindrosporum]KMT23176.1 ribonuclease Z [Clostridium cylindrosporum DSM 605]